MHVSKSVLLKLLPAFLLLVTLGARAASTLETKYAFNIPAQPVATALLSFAEQAKTQVMTSSVDLKNLTCAAVTGEKTARQALEQILRGTGLKYEIVAENAIAIQGSRKQPEARLVPTGVLRLTQNAPAAAQETAGVAEPPKDAKPEENEIRVLGSRIRRTDTEGPSPVAVYDREYIDATGSLTLADFLNKLPQNYAGISAGRGSTPNELNPEVGQRTETTTPAFNFVLGASAATPGQTGVSGVSLRGLGSGSTLVLVNGRRVVQSGAGNRSTDSRQGFVDINTIPLGMVDHIEVITDGASALYGADAVAGVINIVLKRGWTGGEMNSDYKGTMDGGGRERQATLSYGFSSGAVSGNISLQGYDRSPLKASERDFTANQNHTSIVAGYNPTTGAPIMGRDFRLNWGYPGTIQTRFTTSTLAGVTAPNGAATRWATIDSGVINTTPSVGDVTGLPSTLTTASGVVRGNTAEFLDLIPESSRWAASGNLTFSLGETLELYTTYTLSDTSGTFNSQPPVSSASASAGFGNFSTVVPAAYNPFGTDVLVGMVHYGFGSIRQMTNTRAHNAVLGMRGSIGSSWQWDAGVGYQKQIFHQLTRNFNNIAFTNALSNPNPALRFNPFIDVRAAGNPQAALYETMALYPSLDTESDMRSVDFSADGEIFKLPGGAVLMAVGGFFERNSNESYSLNYTLGTTAVTSATTFAEGERESYGAFTEVSVPVFGGNHSYPLMRRLELQFAGRYEDRGDAGSKVVPKVGMSWVPFRSLLVRASYAEGFRAPALTEYQIASSAFTSSLTDPRRNPPSTTGVQVSRGSNPDIVPETSSTQYVGLVIEPPLFKGLNFELNYYSTVQKNAIQVISAQTMLNNEAFFADRITRAPQDPNDIALNQPGRVTAVNTMLVNFGKVTSKSLDFVTNYTLPTEHFGRIRLSLNASHALESSRELGPGVPAVDDLGDTFAPPKWRYNLFGFWNRGQWNASVYFNYLSGFSTNTAGNTLTATYPIRSQTNIDLRGGYTFDQGVFGGRINGLKLSAGIGNVMDEDPAFSDTVLGFNGALHTPLGRTYELSILLPF